MSRPVNKMKYHHGKHYNSSSNYRNVRFIELKIIEIKTRITCKTYQWCVGLQRYTDNEHILLKWIIVGKPLKVTHTHFKLWNIEPSLLVLNTITTCICYYAWYNISECLCKCTAWTVHSIWDCDLPVDGSVRTETY